MNKKQLLSEAKADLQRLAHICYHAFEDANLLDSTQASVVAAMNECRLLLGKKTSATAVTTPTQRHWLQFESASLRASNAANAHHASDCLGQDLVDLIQQPHDPPDVRFCTKFLILGVVYNKLTAVLNHTFALFGAKVTN